MVQYNSLKQMSIARYRGNNSAKVYPYSKPVNTCFRFLNKPQLECEQDVMNNYWQEILNLYGQKVTYYRSNYSTASGDNFYGEDPTRRYDEPREMIIGIDLNENAIMLTKFGIQSDEEVTAYIAYQAFYDVYGNSTEPKAGDVFVLSEYGVGRPHGRTGKQFEITERVDEDASRTSQLMGHYVWLIKAKRFEWSYEPGLSAEGVNNQVYDSQTAGLSGNPMDTKTYTQNFDEDSTKVFNYDNPGSNDDVYGGYGNIDQ